LAGAEVPGGVGIQRSVDGYSGKPEQDCAGASARPLRLSRRSDP
jgi:hypothetical protein